MITEWAISSLYLCSCLLLCHCHMLLLFWLNCILLIFFFLDNSKIRSCPLPVATMLAVPESLVSILCVSASKSLMNLAQTRLLWTHTQHPMQFCSDHESPSIFLSASQKLYKSRPPARGLYAQGDVRCSPDLCQAMASSDNAPAPLPHPCCHYQGQRLALAGTTLPTSCIYTNGT